LFVVDGKATFNLDKKTDYLKISKYFIVFFIIDCIWYFFKRV
jgi:hypothetical protein